MMCISAAACAAAPSVQAVGLPANGTYSVERGHNILRFDVTFGEVVTVDDPYYTQVVQKVRFDSTLVAFNADANNGSSVPAITVTLRALSPCNANGGAWRVASSGLSHTYAPISRGNGRMHHRRVLSRH